MKKSNRILPTIRRCCLVWALSAASSIVWADNIALLIGVGDYPASPLQGPIYDVAAMQDVLMRKWGFSPQNIVTLVNSQATQAAILKQLKALKSRSKAGDHILIYLSGHGTSGADKKLRFDLPYNSGAFVPFGFSSDAIKKTMTTLPMQQALSQHLIIGRWHVLPIISELEKDRDVTIINDSCYSANSTRSFSLQSLPTTVRSMPIVIDNGVGQSTDDTTGTANDDEPYPYQRTVTIAASGEGETAADLPIAWKNVTIDQKPHGLLTDMVLRVLEGKTDADHNKDGEISYAELRSSLQQEIGQYPSKDKQTPSVQPSTSEDRHHLALKPLFGRGKDFRVAADTASTVAATPSTSALVRVALATDMTDADAADAKNMLEKNNMLSNAQTDNQTDAHFFLLKTNGWSLTNRAKEPIVANTTLVNIQQRLLAEQWLRQQQAKVVSKSTLQLLTLPESKNNSFIVGDQFQFSMQNTTDFALILVNIDPSGRFRLLYPIDATENKMWPAQVLHKLPTINAQEPIGLDTVFALTLPKPLANFSQIAAMAADDGVDEQHASVKTLAQLVSQAVSAQQPVAVRSITLRTFSKSSQ